MNSVISKIGIENDNTNVDDIISKNKDNTLLNKNIINNNNDIRKCYSKFIGKGLFMIIETLNEPILIFKNGNFLCCNYLIKKLLNSKLQNIKDFNYKEFLNSSDVKKINLIINNLHKCPCKDFINIKTKTNKNMNTEIRYITDMIDDNMYSVISINNKLNKDNQQSNNFSKNNEDMTNLFHELKTPINVLLSAVQVTDYIIKRESFNNQGRIEKYLKIMKQNCFRLMKLTNNIIDLKKIESGFYKVDLENHNIVDIVKKIVTSVTEYINSKGIIINFYSDVEEKIIACDPDKIERVMLNLISNSVKFTPKGGHIYINIYDKIDKVVLSVKDTGIGIPKDNQKFIFDKYVQVQNMLKMNKGGSGIGLYLVKNIVKNHGGTIYVNSEYVNGCEFIINMPIRIKKNDDLTKNKSKNVFVQSNSEKVDVEFSDI